MKYRKKKTKYVNYNELPIWIKKVEDKINKMNHEEFCDEMIKFGKEAKKYGGVLNLVFKDV
ncbi:protein of unknown function [Methanocaldococcus lauensis]|nr:protein of unknown function [Methanocaldococcus lauensis]